MTRAGTEIDVRIRNIAVGGAGVGEVIAQHDGYQDLLGITAFVPFCGPGETVNARVEEFKGRYLHGALVKIIEPSPERVLPPCPFFMQCGGCELQHLSYGEQLRSKEAMIRGALRAGKLPVRDIDCLQPVVPGDAYAYRRRVTLHLDSEGKLGFYRGSSRSVVVVNSCPVSIAGIDQRLDGLGDFARAVRGKISTVILDADDHGIVATLKSPFEIGHGEKQLILSEAAKVFSDVSLQGPEGEIGGFGRQILDLLLCEVPPVSIRVPAGHFSQVNARINRQLIQKVLEVTEAGPPQVIFDLYAGAGNFSVPLAKAGAQVFAVECDRRLVTFARENAAKYGLERLMQVKDSSVERFLENPPRVPGVHAIIADPPRSGLGTLVERLPKSELLVLISCHLPSCVRDLKLLGGAGWAIEEIVPYDMFAQTSYIEILSVLRR